MIGVLSKRQQLLSEPRSVRTAVLFPHSIGKTIFSRNLNYKSKSNLMKQYSRGFILLYNMYSMSNYERSGSLC